MMEMDNRPLGDHLDQKNHIVAALRRKVQADEKNSSSNSNTNSNSNSNQSHTKETTINHADGGGKDMNTGRWSQAEHNRFLTGLDQYGTGNWKKITEIVGTRSCTQIRTHAQKYFIALQKPQHKYDNAGKASKNTQSHGEHASTNNRYTGRVDGSIYGTRPKKSKKLVIGAKHHIGANIRPGSSAIVAGYGGGGTPIHLSGIVPVTSNLIGFNDGNNSTGILSSCQSSQRSSPALASAPAPTTNRCLGPNGGMRDVNTTGLTAMDLLAQAAIVDNKMDIDNAAAGLRQKMSTDEVNSTSQHKSSNDSVVSGITKTAVEEEASSVVAKAMAQVEAQEAAAATKRKRDADHPGLVPSLYATTAQQFFQNQQQQPPKTMQDTINQNDVLEKLQAVAERQEFLRLRQEVKNLNFVILQLQQQSIESDNRVMEAITDRRNALNECKHLQEISVQLKSELHRMLLLFEQRNQAQKQQTESIVNGDPNNTNNKKDNDSEAQKKSKISEPSKEKAAQGTNADVMQAKLTESELRFHAVSESLSRQTGVLTDQHRAIVELNTQLEQERAKRQSVEFELNQLRLALQQHHQLQQQQQALSR